MLLVNLETQLNNLIEQAYQEDGVSDITSEVLFDEDALKEGVLIAKQAGKICGLKFVQALVTAVDSECGIDVFLEEGDPVKDRMMILALSGKVRSLLRIERVLINFLSRLSGIATVTNRFVQAIEGTGAVILDTRKTIPGWRFLDKYAVTVGGGINHRMNLSDIAMIKDTHVDSCGGVLAAIQRFREKEMTKPLIVEVRTLQEFEEALRCVKTLTRILLDNFTIDMLKKSVAMAGGKVLLEASGNITLENVLEVAKTGVHFISVGALTHSAPGFDFSFKIS